MHRCGAAGVQPVAGPPTTDGEPDAAPAEVILVGCGRHRPLSIGRPTRRPPRSSRSGPGSCSRSATTPTSAAAPTSTATASGRRGAGIKDRIESRCPATTSTRPGAAGYSRLLRRGRRPRRRDVVLRRRRDVARRGARLDVHGGDGGCGAGSPQLAWLRGDLAASKAGCTLALFHHPRFSSGVPRQRCRGRAVLGRAVRGRRRPRGQRPRARLRAVRARRTRRAPRTTHRGIIELIAGTGGADLRTFNDPVPNSRVRSSLAHGVLSLTLRPSGWAWAFTRSTHRSPTRDPRGCH